MKPTERELHQQLFGGQQQSMGAVEAAGLGIKEGVGAFVKGAMDALYSNTVQHFAEHGAHELAAALFNGNAFVMYPRNTGSREDPSLQGPEQAQEPGGPGLHQDQPGHDLERGGPSM